MDENTGMTPPAPEAPEPPAAPAPEPAGYAPAAPPAPAPAADMGGRPGPVTDTSKILAAVGYLVWPVALIAILIDPYKDEKFVKFHGYQALALAVVSMICWFIPYVGWAAGIVVFVFEVIALIKTLGSEYYEVPVVYGVIKGMIGE